MTTSSLSTDAWIRPHLDGNRIQFVRKDLIDLDGLIDAMKGHDIVWHLGANTDIPSGFHRHRIDLDNDVIATFNVLEAMLTSGIKDLLFASTGAVYGESIEGLFKETSGPLMPVSLYGAGKVACEAFISSFCNLFGIRAWMFRFGNVIGERTNHGIDLRLHPQAQEGHARAGDPRHRDRREELLSGRRVHQRDALHVPEGAQGPFPDSRRSRDGSGRPSWRLRISFSTKWMHTT